MCLFRMVLKTLGIPVAVAAIVVALANPAQATGTMTILRANGQSNVYDGVEIKVMHGALFLTSGDGKGTLVIHRAACSYQGKVLVCFPTSATLIQSGEASPLDLKTGTLYFNSTDSPQPLVLSTKKLPAHSLLASFTTYHGTYVSLNGRIDRVVK